MNKHSVCFAAICIMLLSGCATQSLHKASVLMWEAKDNTNGFDKASALTARFLASTSDEANVSVIHRGIKYKPTFVEMVNSYSDIARYAVRIPGPFTPGDEVLQVIHSNGEFTNMDEIKVRIFPSRLLTTTMEDGQEITLEEEITGFIKSLSKGDAIEFTAIPSSGLTIPLQQFRTVIEGTARKEPVTGLIVSSSDGYYVTEHSDKVSVNMVWIDPNDQMNVVKIFPSDGSQSVEAMPEFKRPRIAHAESKRVIVLDKPRFEVFTEIKPPTYPDIDVDISDVSIEIIEQNIHGYRVVPAGTVKYQQGLYSTMFELQGNQPLPEKGGGSVKVRVKASTKSPSGEKSAPASRTFRLPIMF